MFEATCPLDQQPCEDDRESSLLRLGSLGKGRSMQGLVQGQQALPSRNPAHAPPQPSPSDTKIHPQPRSRRLAQVRDRPTPTSALLNAVEGPACRSRAPVPVLPTNISKTGHGGLRQNAAEVDCPTAGALTLDFQLWASSNAGIRIVHVRGGYVQTELLSGPEMRFASQPHRDLRQS